VKLRAGSRRMFADTQTNPVEGQVRWAPAKSIWVGAVTAAAIVLGPLTFSWDAFALFIVTSAVTLCFGHSVGTERVNDFETAQC
jgi:hypothetical protein